MRRSASFQPADDHGFTLIELIIALAVLSLLLGFVLPRAVGSLERLRQSAQHQQVEDALAELGGKARRNGQTISLGSIDNTTNPTANAVIELPPGWKLIADPPIVFHYNGLCSGGVAQILSPAGGSTYRLAPPFCRPQRT